MANPTDEMCHEKFEHDASMPSATVQDDGWGEWQKHDGGECPIPFAEAGEYEIRYGDGTVYGRNGYLKAAAHGPVWTPSPKRELMITHYRLRKPATPPDTLLRDMAAKFATMPCPSVINGKETAQECSDAGQCGCGAAAILERARKAGVR